MDNSSTFKPTPSFWEAEIPPDHCDILIVGAGLVGLQTANFIANARPTWTVAVIDKNSPAIGASTRNAGFACIGSLGELTDDLEQIGFEATCQLIRRRFRGLQILRSSLSDHKIGYQAIGNLEIFRSHEREVLAKAEQLLPQINAALANELNAGQDIYRLQPGTTFGANLPSVATIHNALEGQLNTAAMINTLRDKVAAARVRFLTGEVVTLEADRIQLATGQAIRARQVILATNGFTRRLLPDSQISPALNQVIVSAEVDGLNWTAPMHLEQGYGYIRRIGRRVLVGGFRNHFPAFAKTDHMQLNPAVGEHLRAVLRTVLPKGAPLRIEYEWSGVLGIGPTRNPQVQVLPSGILQVAGLGGMGVALGSLLAFEAAQIITARE